ncbi:molybdenum ABC transporter ATP-binding protein [Pararhodobacter oceanensis]|uniref:molybdenum ABC transporter ATP-binding protein n=1 Tax=Pararhodobacter oceanensis TaxID=2172121 RepID=UPI003A954E41
MLDLSLRHGFEDFTLQAAFTAPAGVTALFGHSGSGKTTIVNALAGLLRPDAGRIVLGDRVLFDSEARVFMPPHKRRIGYVFQDARLFPHLTVRQNLLYGRRFARRAGAGADMGRIVELLGIGALMERRPGALSGGEKQRVAMGRAILSDPELLLMDEPLAALDGARRGEILTYLERLRDETALPILYVSHSVAEVTRLATTLVLIEGGRVRRSGPVEAIMADPDAVPALGLREAGALLTARLAAHDADGLSRLDSEGGSLWLPHVEGPIGAALRLRILAQDVMLAVERPQGISALNVLPARVLEVRQGAGPGALVQLAVGEARLLARVTGRSAKALGLGPGREVYAVIKAVSVARDSIGEGR